MTVFQEMVDFLDAAYVAKDEIVPCLVGPVGIGKTAAVNQHAKNVGASNVVVIIASQILPNEVSGITMPDSSSKSMEIYDHYKLGHLKDGDIVFFDELLEADQSVLSACLTLIESRMLMSGKKLPNIQIIAATNPTVAPGSIKESIRQRFMFREFKLNTLDVRRYNEELFDIKLTEGIQNYISTEDRDRYNFLSPRSLTKICTWFDRTINDDDLYEKTLKNCTEMFGAVTNIINIAFKERQRRREKNQFDKQTIEFMHDKLSEQNVTFDPDSTINDLYTLLIALPNWNDIEKELSETFLRYQDDEAVLEFVSDEAVTEEEKEDAIEG